MIVIRINNIIELARSRSLLGRALARWAPELARSQVKKIVAQQIREELAQHGVEAEVWIDRSDETILPPASAEGMNRPNET